MERELVRSLIDGNFEEAVFTTASFLLKEKGMGKFYVERAKELPVLGEFDVIVVGSGPAGVGAAIAAGRMGARVLCIEAQGSVGGISTSGLMSHFTGRVECPLYEEITRRAAEKNPFPNRVGKQVIDPELLKETYLEMLEESGVTLLLYTFFADVIMEGSCVKGVIVENKTGRSAYFAKAVVDCTGDGDVAFRSGAAFALGRKGDGGMQPATLMFKVGGVDEARAVFPGSFETTVETPKGELQALARAKLPPPAGHVLLYRSTIPSVVTCNMTNVIGVDGTKAEDLTRAERVCRSQIRAIIDFLREYAAGYENCYLLSAASLIGIRETRHFIGERTLTEEDILSARQFEDAVVYGAWFEFDIHNVEGAGLDKHGAQKAFTQTKGYTVPYGCMLPKEVDGLLLSGRNISGTHKAHSSFRAMPICLAIGRADGIAAALAAKTGLKLRDISPKSIQEYL